MKRRWVVLLAFLAGVIACYLTVDWRIGASEAKANLYQVGAMQAYQMLDQCAARTKPRWAK